MSKGKDEILNSYNKEITYGKFTLYSKNKNETKKMIRSLGAILKLKDYQVIDYLLKKEIKEREITT